jgi:hypothetical protein
MLGPRREEDMRTSSLAGRNHAKIGLTETRAATRHDEVYRVALGRPHQAMREVGLGSRAAVVVRLMVRPVSLQGFVTVTYGARIESQGSPGVMPPRRRLATLR